MGIDEMHAPSVGDEASSSGDASRPEIGKERGGDKGPPGGDGAWVDGAAARIKGPEPLRGRGEARQGVAAARQNARAEQDAGRLVGVGEAARGAAETD